MKEYLEALKGRYIRANRKGKGRILDDAVRVQRATRKALIRSLEARPALDRGRKPDRPREYGQEAVAALKAVWEASDRACGKRLRPFLPELVGVL